MKLTRLRISNFQSFGPQATAIGFEAMTFLLGPNGAGKTAVLQALARLFGFDPSLRRVRRTDFHITPKDLAKGDVVRLTLGSKPSSSSRNSRRPKASTRPSRAISRTCNWTRPMACRACASG